MRFLIFATFCFIILLQPVAGRCQQGDVWTLQGSVQYALEHNISIQQNVLNQRLAKFTLLQSQLSQLPNVNTNGAYGRSYGRSVDPTTNQFVNGNYDFLSLSGSSDVLLFGWFQKRNIIAGNKLSFQAAQADLDQIQDDISLNVATGFLRALLAQEQVGISEKQVALSSAQLDQTRRFAEAGRLPELNVAQLESQLAGDSANLITAISDYNAAILDIKALLNLDFATTYKIQVPDVKIDEQQALVSMQPEEIYQAARQNLGVIRSSELKYAAARKAYNASKGGLYPQLALAAQIGTNWASTFREITSFNVSGAQLNGNFIAVGDSVIPVYQPTYDFNSRVIPFGNQLDNNFRQTISLNLNIPLFNAWQAQYSVRQARINMLTQQLNQYQAELTLKQDVYKAHNDARNSIQKYAAASRAAIAAQRAFDFAQKRYDVGLTNTVEYLTTQNTLYVAESRLNSAKYDLIFKLKVIDYYLGKELKL